MRKPLIASVGVAAVAVLILTLIAMRSPDTLRESGSPGNRTAALDDTAAVATRVVEAGGVLVSIEPVRVDDTGAVFDVAFETHTVDLDLDVVASASLEVDGRPWTNPTWDGSPQGGHHREGRLSFDPSGSAAGDVVLTIHGLPEPVVVSWELPD